jgi:BTB/POZ domain
MASGSRRTPVSTSKTLSGQCGSKIAVPKWVKDLWNTGNFSDFTIETEKKEYFVHRTVLSIQSQVFAATFKTDMKENKTGRMKITDFSSEAVKEFLSFFYCGSIPQKNAMEVFALAVKYDVPELKIISEKYVILNINDENAMEVLKLGILYESELIKQKAFQHVKRKLAKLNIFVVNNMINNPENLETVVKASEKYDVLIQSAKVELENTVSKFIRQKKPVPKEKIEDCDDSNDSSNTD